MKLKLPTLFLKNNLLILLFSLFAFSSVTAQITSFGLRVTPTEEVCNGNGVLTMNVSRTQAGAQFEFVIYKLPDVAAPFRVTNGIQASGPNFSVLEHVETAFPSGNYRIIGEITVNVTEGNAITYEIRDLSNSVIIAPQASNVLTPVPPGDYLVVVSDACNDEFTQGITISNPVASYGVERNFFANNSTSVFSVLEDCNNYRHTVNHTITKLKLPMLVEIMTAELMLLKLNQHLDLVE